MNSSRCIYCNQDEASHESDELECWGYTPRGNQVAAHSHAELEHLAGIINKRERVSDVSKAGREENRRDDLAKIRETSEVRNLLSPKFTAAIDLLRATGAKEVDVRFSGAGPQGKDWPVVWSVVYVPDERLGMAPGSFDCASAPNPELAALRLCAHLIDGGVCTHCGKPSVFEDGTNTDFYTDGKLMRMKNDENGESLPVASVFCVYAYEPGLGKFIRSCD